MKKITLLLLLLSSKLLFSQKLYPPSWFSGLQHKEFQLIIKEKNIGLATEWKSDNPHLQIQNIEKPANQDYIILNLFLSDSAEPGSYTIHFKRKNKKRHLNYKISSRGKYKAQTLTQRDLVYLLMPDRFANGDTNNDDLKGYKEKRNSPDSAYGRHHGDLQGIINKLPYLKNLGATALWLNPVYENDEPLESYHGYAITNHYKIDARLGDHAQYIHLADELHANNMKLIKDMIYNHVGDGHSFYADLIDSSWFHWWNHFQKTNYRAPLLMDPYAAKSDKDIFLNGWFDHHMPDLNTANPQVSQYLIQQTLWWILNFNLDGIRIDTYAYPGEEFTKTLMKYLQSETPTLSIFTEIWDHGPGIQAYFGKDNLIHSQAAPIDFQLAFAIQRAFTQKPGWTEGIASVYYTLAQDYLYPNGAAKKMLTFMDNHDLPRAFGVFGKDTLKMESALKMLMLFRGIPSIYYGTEQLQSGTGNDDDKRRPWKGGFEGDQSPETYEVEPIASLIRKLSQLRQNHPAFDADAKETQFIPKGGKYVYFRSKGEHGIALLASTEEKRIEFRLDDYPELYNAIGRNEMNVLEMPGITIPRSTVFGLNQNETVVLVW